MRNPLTMRYVRPHSLRLSHTSTRLLLLAIAIFLAGCAPSAQPETGTSPRRVEIALDSPMHVDLLYGTTPVAYQRVTRLRGYILSTNADTIRLQVTELLFLQGPPLRVASRTGAPLATVILDRSRRAAPPRQSTANIGQSLAELLLVLRFAVMHARRSSEESSF
jgi:hypothetical protein